MGVWGGSHRSARLSSADLSKSSSESKKGLVRRSKGGEGNRGRRVYPTSLLVYDVLRVRPLLIWLDAGLFICPLSTVFFLVVFHMPCATCFLTFFANHAQSPSSPLSILSCNLPRVTRNPYAFERFRQT